MKKIKIILILVITILISGCSYKELNDLAIASALGIDYQNNEYIISAQIMELKKQEKEDTSSALIYLGKGKTISEALRNISLKYPNYLYLGHLELIIIGKGEINHGINNSLDYFIRTSDARNDALILVSTKNKAYEIINPNEETKEEFPVKDIVTTIRNSKERNGLVIEKNYEELINDYLERGISQILTTIENEKDENDNYKDTILSNIAVFEKGKYVKDLDKEKALEIAKSQAKKIEKKANELYEVAKEKGTPVVEKAVSEVKDYALKAAREVVSKLESEEESNKKVNKKKTVKKPSSNK